MNFIMIDFSVEFRGKELDVPTLVQGYKKSGQQGWAQQEVNWGADYLMKCISKNDSDATLIYQVWAGSVFLQLSSEHLT